MGAKLAQRIVLEMKDKVGALAPSGGMELPEAGVPGGVSAAGNAAEAAAALTVLGFTPGEAAAAVGRLDSALPGGDTGAGSPQDAGETLRWIGFTVRACGESMRRGCLDAAGQRAALV